MNKIVRIRILDKVIKQFDGSEIPDVKASTLFEGLNISKLFRDEHKTANRYFEVDISDADIGSPCYIVQDGSYSRTLSCLMIETLIMRTYYQMVKSMNKNPLAQSRLARAINNLDKTINDINTSNAYACNLVLAEMKIDKDKISYVGNSPVSFLFDYLYSQPIDQSCYDVVEYKYTGPQADKFAKQIKSLLDVAKCKFEPPSFFGISAYAKDALTIDSALSHFLVTQRHLLMPVASQMYSLNCLSEIVQVTEYAAASTILMMSLDHLVSDDMENTIHLVTTPNSITDVIKMVYDIDTEFEMHPERRYDVLACSDSLKLVCSFLKERDIMLLMGHPSTVVRLLEQGCRIELNGGYITIDAHFPSNIKAIAVCYRELIKASTALFNSKCTLRDNMICCNMRDVLAKELRIC